MMTDTGISSTLITSQTLQEWNYHLHILHIVFDQFDRNINLILRHITNLFAT